MRGVRFWRNPGNGWAVQEVHYTSDPEKRSREWIASAKKGMAPEIWEQEMEMNENAMSGVSIYRDVASISSELFKPNLKWQPGKTIYRGWDFGYQLGACVLAYKNTRDQFVVLKEILVFQGTTMDLARKVQLECSHYSYKTDKNEMVKAEFEDFADIAGKHHSSTSVLSDIEQLNSIGIYPMSIYSDIERGLDKIRHLLRIRPKDGLRGLLIDLNNCDYLKKGFLGAYAYGKNGKPSDEFVSDPHDAFRYMIDNLVTHLIINEDDDEDDEIDSARFNSSGLPMRW